MASKDRWGSVFSKSKTWVGKLVEETTTADHRKADRLESERDDLERAVRREAQMNAVRQAIPGLDSALDAQDERRAAAATSRDASARAARVESFNEGSWLQLGGEMSGRVDGLAIRREDWSERELITLESIDPVHVSGGTFEALSFVVMKDLAVGQHDLAQGYDNGEGYELWAGGQEPYQWCPDYGVGLVARDPDGSLRFAFAMMDSGSARVDVSGVIAGLVSG